MAIGKQGAYATVQGGAVDFGKITTDAIDKYQTQQALQEKLKQEKAAAKAKLASDEVKNLRVMGKYTSSGMKEIDDPALLLVGQYRNALGELGRKVEAGEASSLEYNQVVGKADQSIEVMSNAASYAKERAAAYSKLADEGKLNPDFVSPEGIKDFMKNTVPVLDENGSITYNYTDSDGNVIKTENPKEIIDKVFGNPVLKVDLNSEVKKIKDVLDQDKIATAGSKFVVTQTEKSQRFLSGVSSSAVNLLGDRNVKAELWSDYQKSLPEDKRTGPKADGFSEKENQDLYNYTYNKILGYYPEEKSLAGIPKSGGGGGGNNSGDKDDTRKTTKFTAPTDGVGNAYGISKNKKGEGVVYKSIELNGKRVTNFDAEQFYWDKKGNLVIIGSYESVKTSRMSPKDKKDYNAIISAVLSDNATSEQEERYSELIDTYGSQRVKKSAKISSGREYLIEPIATKLGYGSVDDFYSDYKPNISQKTNTTNKTNTKKQIKGF